MQNITVRVKAKIVEDETGAVSHLPVLLTENESVVSVLLNYVLMLKRNGVSLSTINTVVTATQKLLDYISANHFESNNAARVFELFCSRLQNGTVDEFGHDKSRLYWKPVSRQTAHQYIYVLTQFTDWIAEHQSISQVNPAVQADSWTEQLQYAAWYRKNQHDFLGHIHSPSKFSGSMRRTRGPRPLPSRFGEAIAFPESQFELFYLRGIGSAKDYRVALRDKLILLLIHGGPPVSG